MSWVRRRYGLWLMALGFMLASSTVRAQGSCTVTDENGKTVNRPNCQDPNERLGAAKSPSSAPSSAAKSFPFPGETPGADPANPAAAPAQAAPVQTPATDPNLPASKRFPFPGEASGDDGVTKPSPELQDTGSSGSSSSDSSRNASSSSSSDNDGGVGPLADDDDPAAAAAAARKARKKLPKLDPQTPNEREQEDLSVAAFYQNDANYKGAYERAKDAVSIAADDPDAHFALAEAARRLGKLDEAEANYKKCLALDPVPKERKAAEKALKEMAGG